MTMSASSEPFDARTNLLGLFAILFVVAGGIVASLLELSHRPTVLGVIGLAIAYLLVMIFVGEAVEREPSPWRKFSYFTLECALAAGIAALFAHRSMFGMSWLILMPLLAQARMLLQPLATALVCLACMGIVAGHLVWLEVDRGDLFEALVSVSTAVVFVLLFTDIAARARQARAESERLTEQLAVANQKLSEYAVQVEELATARERGRMAREIHDSLGHYLTVVNIQLEVAETLFDRDPDKARSALGKAQTLNQQGLAEIRQSVAALRSSPLEGRLLEAVLNELVQQSNEAGLPTRLDILGDVERLDPKAELTVYRTVQEGLTNARKYSQARRVDLTLDYRTADRVVLRVKDDGVGAAEPTDGFGLLGVRERVRQLDGIFAIDTRPGQGFKLEVEIPR